MTTYGAYDAGLKCENPACKSYGKPHPNCRCHPGYAEGGQVEHFCSSERMHDKKCQHYTEEKPQSGDSHHSVASYLAHHGLHGLLEFGSKPSEDSLHHYNRSIKKGSKKFEKYVDHLFDGGDVEKEDYTDAHKAIEEWMEKGGIVHDINQELYNHHAPQEFADGGPVQNTMVAHDPHISQAYPEQNMMLQAAKGRMSDYLNTLRPQKHQPKLAFDPEPDQTEKKKAYKKAIETAAHPLGILQKIKSGKIDANDVKNLKGLHPEVDEMIQRKMTDSIVKDQLKGKKPSYKIRQGMSLYLGVPLSGEMTPQNIQAAQAVFGAQKAANSQGQQPPAKNKKGTSSLTKSDDAYLTSNQSRAARQQKQ